MKIKKFFLLVIIIISAIAFLGIFHSIVKPENASTQKNNEQTGMIHPKDISQNVRPLKVLGVTTKVIPFGIKNPDGEKTVWVISPHGSGEMTSLLKPYSYKLIDGVPFYEITSWKDTSKLISFSYEDQNKMIWTLYTEISLLKTRVKSLEEKLEVSKKIK